MNAFAWWWAFCQSAISRSTLTAKCPPPRLGDPPGRDLYRARARDDALGRRSGDPRVNKLDHLRDGEPVREHHRFGAAVAAGGEQLERAAAAGATDLYSAQAPAVLYHSRTLLQGDGDAGPTVAGGDRWL
jgi:hypothetical protein